MNILPRFMLALTLLATLAACADNSDEAMMAQSSFPFIRMAPLSPPDTPYEQKPYLSDPASQTWRPGYWSYNGMGSFTWTSGEVLLRPTPSAVWSPDRWEKREYGWVFVPGFWQ